MKSFVPIISALIIGCATIIAALIATNKQDTPAPAPVAVHEEKTPSSKQTESVVSSKSKQGKTASSSKKYINNFPDPSWIIADELFKSERKAKRRVEDLKELGYTESNFLWIPDFKCLEQQEQYLVYIGPYDSSSNARDLLCAYNRKYHKESYIAKISSQAPQSLKCGKAN